MNSGFAWMLVAAGVAVVGVRRRTSAIALVTLQSLALAVAALWLARDRDDAFLLAAAVLAVKAVAIGAALGWSVARTREAELLRDDLPVPVRLIVAAGASLGFAALVPAFGLRGSLGDAAVALVIAGGAIVVLRSATILQATGLLVAENGIMLAAVAAPRGLPLIIELGFAFDVVVIVATLLVVHERIFGAFGAGDTRALRSLRDSRR